MARYGLPLIDEYGPEAVVGEWYDSHNFWHRMRPPKDGSWIVYRTDTIGYRVVSCHQSEDEAHAARTLVRAEYLKTAPKDREEFHGVISWDYP